MLLELSRPQDASQVLDRLRALCVDRGLEELAENFHGLLELIGDDMRLVEESLQEVIRRTDLVERSASHLLDLSGKRIRPLCVALASRIGGGFTPQVLDLAVAVELIHNATLLHDDVVDLADERRGSSTARAEFGNAASIFAGDWLLIRALQRVERTALPGALDRLLETIAQMIAAESLQLENRGRLEADPDLYFRIAEGKSAMLFRWAMHAGGRAGGLDATACGALEGYGLHLGIAFQVIDDLLDLTGEAEQTGKALFADLREGKMTYPLILTLERDPRLRMVVEEIVHAAESPPRALFQRVVTAIRETGAMEACREVARERATEASRCLELLPRNPASAALALVAESMVERRS